MWQPSLTSPGSTRQPRTYQNHDVGSPCHPRVCSVIAYAEFRKCNFPPTALGRAQVVRLLILLYDFLFKEFFQKALRVLRFDVDDNFMTRCDKAPILNYPYIEESRSVRFGRNFFFFAIFFAYSACQSFFCAIMSFVSSDAIQKARRFALRGRSAVACIPCKDAKTKCNDYRPCSRCKKLSQEKLCTDEVRC